MAEVKQMKFAVGSYEEGKSWVGREARPYEAKVTITREAIEHFCEAMEDPNPLYWSDEFAAKTRWGGRVAPSAALTCWTLAPLWRPPWMEDEPQQMFASEVPLPGDKIIATEYDFEYFQYARVGDRLTMKQRLLGIEPITSRSLGKGYNLLMEMSFVNHDGEVIGVCKATFMRYGESEK